MDRINYAKLSASILICLSAGAIGSLFTVSSVSTWYQSLNKPFFNPPSWLFGPVWTLLYLLMGISVYLVWSTKTNPRNLRIGFGLFGVQLALNTLWSILFFGLRSPLLAFIEIILLWFAILATIAIFRNISRTASLLLVPYIIWVSFAAVLNFAILILN